VVQEVGTSRLLFEEVSGEKLLLSEEAEQLKILLKREIQKLDGELRAKVRSGDRRCYKINAGRSRRIGIGASCISVCCRSIYVPDWVLLPGSGIFVHCDISLPKSTLLRRYKTTYISQGFSLFFCTLMEGVPDHGPDPYPYK
jgi:hypothetical protein